VSFSFFFLKKSDIITPPRGRERRKEGGGGCRDYRPSPTRRMRSVGRNGIIGFGFRVGCGCVVATGRTGGLVVVVVVGG
jgi:hypothetical protein